MRLNWTGLDIDMFALVGFSKPDVLVEYDGPLLALYDRKDGRPKLGVAADWEGARERWVLADISKIELESLALGDLPVREVFAKDRVDVVDFSRAGAVLDGWTTGSSTLPDGVLPEVGAPLPSAARAYLTKKNRIKRPDTSRLRFAGAPVYGSEIELSALARTMGTFQALWSALGETIGVPAAVPIGPAPSALRTDQFASGSFAAPLRTTDNASFEKILDEYARVLTLARDNPGELLSGLNDSPALQRLRDYMKALRDLRLEVVVETSSTAVYVGHERAKFVSAALKESRPAPPEKPVETKRKFERDGYFEEIGLTERTFEFVDVKTGETIKGSIASKLAKVLRDKGVTVGGANYIATFVQKAGKFELIGFEARQRSLF